MNLDMTPEKMEEVIRDMALRIDAFADAAGLLVDSYQDGCPVGLVEAIHQLAACIGEDEVEDNFRIKMEEKI